MKGSTVAFAAVTPEGATSAAPDDPARAVLELRDLVMGVQAQLDEIHSRLDELDARLRAHESAAARPGLARRARSRAGRVKRSIGRRAR
jgi:hypothetical protein